MQFKLTTYSTLLGSKKIIETIKKKSTQAIIYKDDKPAFFVDCFDLQTESNVLMNSLVLCSKRHMVDVINDISKKNNVNLQIKTAPTLSRRKATELIELDLPPLPEEWLN